MPVKSAHTDAYGVLCAGYVAVAFGVVFKTEEQARHHLLVVVVPDAGLEARSTTSLRKGVTSHLPYRIDLAGTWIDQPYVSRYGAGWALTDVLFQSRPSCGF